MTEPTRRAILVAPTVTFGWLVRLASLIAAILALAGSAWPSNPWGWAAVLFIASFVVP